MRDGQEFACLKFAYAKLLAEWFEAKGKPEIKKEKVVGLREIYKRVLYKK